MKTISISDENWEYLQTLKLKGRYNSIDEVLNLILIHTKEAIKRKDLFLK